MEAGLHVQFLVEGALKPEQEAAVILHRLMVVVLVVDHRQKLKLAILKTVQVMTKKPAQFIFPNIASVRDLNVCTLRHYVIIT